MKEPKVMDEDNFDKWINFLDPQNFKKNLTSISIYIAFFETFKDYVVDEVKSFYNTGFAQNEDKFCLGYKKNVLVKDKNVLNASLIWLQEMNAICEQDIAKFHQLRKFRNKLTHEMMGLLFEGVDELPQQFKDLITLKIKIEKWWIMNVEIPSNPKFDGRDDIKEDDIGTSSEMLNRLITDILSDDEKTANYYKDEFIKFEQQKKESKNS
ncbi:hypothetical protein [Ancylomarina euxinus]|nr:hypothetical protein [Ancylomarina euxinus]MCZ4695529.1 hypothetical protein [Ancylomarina euxinus]MUP15654.1 hypothetical protein [Ancylomarina euxinus]